MGLPGLLQTLRNLDRTEILYITGPEGLEKEMEPILKLARRLSYPIGLIEIPSGGLRFPSPFTFRTYLKHAT